MQSAFLIDLQFWPLTMQAFKTSVVEPLYRVLISNCPGGKQRAASPPRPSPLRPSSPSSPSFLSVLARWSLTTDVNLETLALEKTKRVAPGGTPSSSGAPGEGDALSTGGALATSGAPATGGAPSEGDTGTPAHGVRPTPPARARLQASARRLPAAAAGTLGRSATPPRSRASNVPGQVVMLYVRDLRISLPTELVALGSKDAETCEKG